MGEPPDEGATEVGEPLVVGSPRQQVVESEPADDLAEADGPHAAVEDATGAAVAEDAPPSPELAKHRRLLYLTLPGCWGALILASLSFTPSLLPRDGLLQGMVCGISAAIGYGLGVLAAWIWRAFADRDPRPPRRRSWLVLVIVAVVLFAVSFGLGQYWQHEIRQLMGVTDFSLARAVALPFVAALVFGLILLIGRGLRGLYRLLAKLLNRWIGPRAARATGWILVTGLTYLVVSGVLLDGLVNAANEAFSVRNSLTEDGVVQPTSNLRSGGPGSLVSWDSLGRQGRKFTGTGPSAAEIGQIISPAMEPIRAYAGLESADDTEARAALAVADLDRAGGFQRKNLLVVTTTGSGWVDEASVDAFEYLSGGDSAIVAIQYSYLPSWISYLVDQSKARAAGRELYDAVYDRWSKLPLTERPRLFVGGESLGSFGGETAFSGEYDLRNRTAGTLFTGPPNFNTLFRDFSDHRDPGSPEVEPVFKNGRTVRFTNDPVAGYPPTSQPWDGSRVVYLMHPSDPIVWWSPRLILSEPSWIGEAPGKDVLEGMVWIPFVTFWQVTADLPFATGVPGGHGHKYTTEYVDAWNIVMQQTGATTQDLTDIRNIISAGY